MIPLRQVGYAVISDEYGIASVISLVLCVEMGISFGHRAYTTFRAETLKLSSESGIRD